MMRRCAINSRSGIIVADDHVFIGIEHADQYRPVHLRLVFVVPPKRDCEVCAGLIDQIERQRIAQLKRT
jgi:hypothetical protein